MLFYAEHFTSGKAHATTSSKLGEATLFASIHFYIVMQRHKMSNFEINIMKSSLLRNIILLLTECEHYNGYVFILIKL